MEDKKQVKVIKIVDDVSPFDGYEDPEDLEQQVVGTDLIGEVEHYNENDDLIEVYFPELDAYGSFYSEELEFIEEEVEEEV